MSDYKPIIDVIAESGAAPALPEGLDPAIKFVSPGFRTHGDFDWCVGRDRWVESPDDSFDPKTCVGGGLHVANTFVAAQSGGATATHCLWVAVDPDEAGPWEYGKRKAPRVWVAGPP